jgi:hypothetical protein
MLLKEILSFSKVKKMETTSLKLIANSWKAWKPGGSEA